MGLIVQKFGGTSVADIDRVFNVAKIVTSTYDKGNDVIVVVSAQGDTTDDLIEKANKINEDASRREMDVLLAAGEQMSAAILSMAIEKLGYPVVSLLGWQVGMTTNSNYGNARIKRVATSRIKRELDKKNIVVVAGFQGTNQYDDITTFGRGGSDTTAVAIAVVTDADLCQIYTDVEGIYTADPRKVKNARKLSEISYDEMLELATLGAQVLNNRSVEMAKKHNIELEVISSITKRPGTIVKEATKVEDLFVSGVAKDCDSVRISVIGVPDKPGFAFKLFTKLGARNISVDVILQSIGNNGKKDITFTVSKDKQKETLKILSEYMKNIPDSKVEVDSNIAKVSIVGAGMESHAGIAAQMFEALFDAQVNIQMISTSEIKISVLIDEKDADKAVSAIHDRFFG